MRKRNIMNGLAVLLVIIGLAFTFSYAGCGSSTSSGGGGGGGGSTCDAFSGSSCVGDCDGSGYSNNGGTTCYSDDACTTACTHDDTTVTQLKITNVGSSEVTIGFKTAAVGGVCTSADELLTAEELSNEGFCSGYIAGVESAGQCTFTLDAAGGANDSVTVPNPDGKCLSGGFGIGGYASCGTVHYPDGWTQGEFTFNPQISGAQETVDISGVNGINYALSIEVGDGWTYGPDVTAISTVGPNKAAGSNVGNPGVFPDGCTDCIQLVGSPPCPDLTTHPTCNSSRICNVYRTTGGPGGTIEFKVGDLL
jgi:hypothetical protein